MNPLKKRFLSATKFAFFLMIYLGTSTDVSSQSIDGKPIREIEAEYIQIIGYQKLLSSKVIIHLDYGQKTLFFNSKKPKFTDENGKEVTMDSMINALNFMHKNGYELVGTHSLNDEGCNTYYYVLKKRLE